MEIRSNMNRGSLELEEKLTCFEKMTDKAELKITGDEEKRLKRKQSLETSVTLGLGSGKKKKLHIKAFYIAVWPVL